jgi:hypothetical protein
MSTLRSLAVAGAANLLIDDTDVFIKHYAALVPEQQMLVFVGLRENLVRLQKLEREPNVLRRTMPVG